MNRYCRTLIFLLFALAISFLFFLLTESDFNFRERSSTSKPDSTFSDTKTQSGESLAALSLIPQDSLSVRILLTGDSMCEGILRRLDDYCAYNNYRVDAVIWSSSTLPAWSSRDTLKKYINKYKPNYIMFLIGSNELLTPNSNARRRYIENIEKQMSGIRSIWIGPPNWTIDAGINELIKSIVGAGRFFPSHELSFDRLGDGAHPTIESAAGWMDSIAVWIQTKSKYPLAMKFPDVTSNKRGQITYLSIPKPISKMDSSSALQKDTLKIPETGS